MKELKIEKQKLPFSLEEYKERLMKVRLKMEEAGVNTLLLTAPENIYYLTGYHTLGYFSYQLLLIPLKEDPILLTRHLNVENAQATSWISHVEGYMDTEDPNLSTYKVLDKYDLLNKSIGTQNSAWFFTVAQYLDLKGRLGNGNLVDCSGLVEEVRLITCHLGNGCSVSAVAAGRCLDTSMGFTPLEGLVMGTRSGDLDPALVPVLGEVLGLEVQEVIRLLNEESGLLGLSGVSNDMREVQRSAAEGNQRAQLALEVFCYRVRKYVGAYLAALGGAEAVVFSAGIGENSPEVRRRICAGLEELGIELDDLANEATRGSVADISRSDARVRVLVIPTDEERMIAGDTYEIACGVRQPSGG